MESLKGKLTEEEAKELLSNVYKTDISLTENGNTKFYRQEIISRWKEKGYVKQNPVEKAEEEMFKYRNSKYPYLNRLDDDNKFNAEFDLINVLHAAIICLKEQLEDK